MLRPRPLPIRGVSNATPYIDERGDLSPIEEMRNVRPFRTTTDRLTLGQRPGIKKTFSNKIAGGSPVQAMGVISRASAITGYSLGSCSDLSNWTSNPSGPIHGNVWFMNPDRGLYASYLIDVTAEGGPAAAPANAIDYAVVNSLPGLGSWTVEYAAVAVSWLNATTGFAESVIVLLNPDGTEKDRIHLFLATEHKFVNTLHIDRRADTSAWLHACVGSKVYSWGLINFDNAKPLSGAARFMGIFDLNGWAHEAIEARSYYDAQDQKSYVLIGFNGANSGGFYGGGVGSGTIQAGKYARHFRSGVMKCEYIEHQPTSRVLQQVPYGPQLSDADSYRETVGSPAGARVRHGYWRLSEQSVSVPHGGLVRALDVDSSGNVYLATTNQGWGPNPADASFQPDGLTSPYLTLRKIDRAGVLQWETDTFSIREVGDGGFVNDIPTAGDPNTTLELVRADSQGNVYCGGRLNTGGYSFMKFSPDGVFVWGVDLMGAGHVHTQAAISMDGSDDQPIVGGERNIDWIGSGGKPAHLWKRNAVGGEDIWAKDLAEPVGSTGVAVHPDGRIIYCTGAVP